MPGMVGNPKDRFSYDGVQITEGDDNDRFIMVGTQINVQATLSYATKSTYELKVEASDGSRSATATATISLYTSNYQPLSI